MQMSDFIDNNLEAILQEWEDFAERQLPAAAGMTRTELRNLAAAILRSVAEDMRSAQSEEERHEKSTGGHQGGHPDGVSESARGHAGERLTEGFSLNQLAGEYRALRASVIRRWRAETGGVSEDALEELTRFNEAIDESLIEAIGWYNARIEDARDLLNGVLAHDLRSPLGAVLSSAEVLLRDETLNARQMHIIDGMRNSATRIRNMISDLLDFTRTRLGTGLPMAIGECDMGTVVRDVVEEQRAFHPDAPIRCETSGDLAGDWDSSRVEQMLANLIGNAIEHGQQSPVTVTAEGQGDEVVVKIHNRGSLIPGEERRVIFDPLKRAAVRGGGEGPVGAGLGLGLYIARQIAEAHDGAIDLDSSQGEGTTFTVRLPRQPRKGAEKAGLT